MNGAASAGHLEVMKWLNQNRIEAHTTYTMNYARINAAKGGHLEVIKWSSIVQQELWQNFCQIFSRNS